MPAHNLIDIMYVKQLENGWYLPVRAWFDNQSGVIVKDIDCEYNPTITFPEAYIIARSAAKDEKILFIDAEGHERKSLRSGKTNEEISKDMEQQKKVIEVLAKRIAGLYAKPDEQLVCACIGSHTCSRFNCPHVWEYIISNPTRIRTALDLLDHVETVVRKRK